MNNIIQIIQARLKTNLGWSGGIDLGPESMLLLKVPIWGG